MNINSVLKKDADSDGKYMWNCEFCYVDNIMELDEEELPSNEALNYILEGAAAHAVNEGKVAGDDELIIFCIDTSGSMCMSKPVDGKHALKNDRKNALKDLNSQFGDGSYQFLEGENQTCTYISRMQCV